MKILYYSDIHLEVWAGITRIVSKDSFCMQRDIPYPLSLGPDLRPFKGQGIDVVVLAGDIGRFVDQWEYEHPVKYCMQVADYLDCDVIFVPGNHEYYQCQDFYAMREKWRTGYYNNRVYVLDDISVTLSGVRFIGSTLWTDYHLLGWEYEADCMNAADKYMADHRGAIRKIGANGGKKNFSPVDARKLCMGSQVFIENMLESANVPTVIVTHHVPLVSSETQNPRFPIDATTSGFMSHLPKLVEKAADCGTKAWIFGHHHYSLQSEAFGVKMLSSQLGYPTEHNFIEWNGPQILEI